MRSPDDCLSTGGEEGGPRLKVESVPHKEKQLHVSHIHICREGGREGGREGEQIKLKQALSRDSHMTRLGMLEFRSLTREIDMRRSR